MMSPLRSSQLAPLSYVLRFLILIVIISFERVVGLPILTIGLALQWSELLGERDVFFLIILTGVLLAVYYQLSFTGSILMCAVGFGLLPVWVWQRRFMTPWVMGVVVVLSVLVGWVGDVPVSFGVGISAVLSFMVLFFSRQWTSRHRASTTWF